jgi:hypothetical protein
VTKRVFVFVIGSNHRGSKNKEGLTVKYRAAMMTIRAGTNLKLRCLLVILLTLVFFFSPFGCSFATKHTGNNNLDIIKN